MTKVGKPYACSDAQWEEILPFVESVLATVLASPRSRSRHGLVNLVARYIAWGRFQRGYPLETVVFRREAINHYVATVLADLAPKTRTGYRSMLHLVSDIVLPPNLVRPAGEVIPNTTDNAPYTDADVTRLVAWANGQPTQNLRRNSNVILALGLGAGLRLREMNRVLIRDLTIDDDGVVIDVGGPAKPRVVPVLAEWENVIIDAADGLKPDDYLFRPGRRTSKKMLDEATSSFLRRTKMQADVPNPYRLRNTWVVRHLVHRVPLDVLSRASGINDAQSLMRFLPFVPECELDAVRAMLRGARNAKLRAIRGGRA